MKSVAYAVRKLKMRPEQWAFLRTVAHADEHWAWPGRSIFNVQMESGEVRQVHLQNFPPGLFECINNVWKLTPRGYAIGMYEPKLPLLKEAG